MGRRDDEIVEVDVAYSYEALKDLEDDQLIDIEETVKQLLDERMANCKRLITKRTKRKKAAKKTTRASQRPPAAE